MRIRSGETSLFHYNDDVHENSDGLIQDYRKAVPPLWRDQHEWTASKQPVSFNARKDQMWSAELFGKHVLFTNWQSKRAEVVPMGSAMATN